MVFPSILTQRENAGSAPGDSMTTRYSRPRAARRGLERPVGSRVQGAPGEPHRRGGKPGVSFGPDVDREIQPRAAPIRPRPSPRCFRPP